MTLRRASLALVAVAGAVLGSAGVAFATFTGAASVSQTVSSRSLSAPGSLAGGAVGHGVALTWSGGSGGTAYTVSAASSGTSSACAGATYTPLGTTSLLTWADPRWAPQGTYECYRVATTYGTWTSLNPPAVAVQVGVVAASVSTANGTGSSSRLDTGDRIVVTFNQPIAVSSQPSPGDSVCTSTSGYVALGSTGTGASCSSTGLELGTMAGLSVGATSRFAATWSWNAAATVLTITVGARTAGATPTVTGTGTFTPTTATAALLSDSGGYHVCTSNTGGGNCLPAATGSF